MPETKEWTVMFYFASDNPLAPGIIAQLKAIKNAGYHPDANVIAQFDPYAVNMPVHVFDVNMVEKLKYPGQSNIGFLGNDPFVRNLVLDKLWDKEIKAKIQERTGQRIPYNPPVPSEEMSKEQNPKQSFEAFLEFCRKEYPARHYILFIIGHGIIVGNDLFMYDEHGAMPTLEIGAKVSAHSNGGDSRKDDRTVKRDATEEPVSPQHSLLLTDLGKILNDFKGEIAKANDPGQFELIGFHSCSMSGVEVALELKGTANYMLASQGPAYVGSWPYRQILIRLFNDLESAELPNDNYAIARGLIDKVKGGNDRVSEYLRRRLNGNASGLTQDSIQEDRKLIEHVLNEFDNPDLCEQTEVFPKETSRVEAAVLVTKHRAQPLNQKDLRRLNRLFLEETFEDEMKSVQIKDMITKIFYYYIYNCFDFQLAGYSSDLTMCDLNKVGYLQRPLDELAAALIKGLDYAEKNPLLRDAMLLAHWEAQSFYEENYTDLYDFCFRLKDKLKNPVQDSETGGILNEIRGACDQIMEVLKRGDHNDDYGPIVRSEFCGPTYQYSHGLSVFFPWSEPVANPMWDHQYGHYKLNRKEDSNEEEKEICWKTFLETYFEKTMRTSKQVETDEREAKSRQPNLDKDLLDLLQSIGSSAFVDGQLGTGGPRDPMGSKGGGLDPTGDNCECASIKNYPLTTGPRPPQNGKSKSRTDQRKPEDYATAASPSLIRGIASQLTE